MIDDAAKKALAVARQMGAADSGVTAYHGSFSPDIKKFDQSKLGQRFNNAASRHGMWLSTNPEDADFYGPHTYQTTLHGKFKQLPSMEELGNKVKDRLSRVSMNPNVNYETSQQAERMLDFYNATQDPRLYTGAASAAINKAKREGYHGAVLKGGETVQENSPPGDNYVVFHPETLDLRRLKASGGMIDDPAKAIRRAVLVAKGLSRAIGPMPGKDYGERVHPASLIPGVHVQAIEPHTAPDGYADGGDVSADMPEPKRTVKAYKLFKTKKSQPGQLFPLFVNADKPVEMGKWLAAEAGPQGKDPRKVKSALGDLAYRPGWHSGDLPVATHIGGKSSADSKAPDYRPDHHVWAEVEHPADVDWQAEANSRARTGANGQPIANTAHITDQVPHGGFYRYKTNPNMSGHWLISGGMKVNRVLSDDEVKEINDAHGVADLPRRAFGGEVQPTDETGFDAFHGTPHSFDPEPGAPLGRFRSDKIGTGEGAQAFGHGLYVGEEGTARGYRDRLKGGPGSASIFDTMREHYNHEKDFPMSAADVVQPFLGKGSDLIKKTLAQHAKKLKASSNDYDRYAAKQVEDMSNDENLHEKLNFLGGHIYHVRVNANPEHFLDWDKPLSEQHPAIQRFAQTADISAAKGKTKGVLNAWREGRDVGVEATGKDLHHALSDYGENSPAAARALHAAGIPGIRYLDANSRGPTGNPTHNHVIFDPSIIDIKRRYKRGGGVHGYKTDGFVPSGGEVSGYKDVPFQHIEKRSPGWGATWTPLETVSEKIGNLNKISENAANYGDFMNSMAHKASTQGLSPRDLIKAYLMTISSQGRAAVTPHTILKNWPEYPGPTHENIRPEGAMGEWLSSPIGKRYLDNAEQGKIDQGAIDHALNAFKGFGKVNDAEGTALPWAVHSLAPHTKIVSDMIAASLKGRHPAEDWRNWVKENVNGVGFAKAGFWGSMLGRGDQGVPDARQLVLNTPNKSKEATNLIGVGESRPANLREKEAMQRLMDRQRALSFAIPKELAPHYHALAHHTIWDAAEGTDTTHQDVINAMQHAATGGTIHPAHEHPLARAMREIGMPGLDGHYDNIDHALSVVRSHKPHRR